MVLDLSHNLLPSDLFQANPDFVACVQSVERRLVLDRCNLTSETLNLLAQRCRAKEVSLRENSFCLESTWAVARILENCEEVDLSGCPHVNDRFI
jgi:hypothetical protein